MLLYSVLLLVGFLVLFYSADQFVTGSAATAINLRISPMIIGLTVVALGTSAPEIFVAVAASLKGEPELAIGNAIGSNIANMGMVLGITAILVPLPFRPDVLRNDLPIMIIVTLCAGVALYDFQLTPWDGLFLLAGLVLFLIRIGLDEKISDSEQFIDAEAFPCMSTFKAVIILCISLVFVLISAQLLVYSSVAMARHMGVSELIIGLTVIAVGTSLPELSVSVTSALRGQTDLAIGNILGSNIFNLLTVLPIPGLLSPSHLDRYILIRDLPAMFVFTIVLFITAYGFRGPGHVNRYEGSFLLLLYFGYLGLLYYTTH